MLRLSWAASKSINLRVCPLSLRALGAVSTSTMTPKNDLVEGQSGQIYGGGSNRVDCTVVNFRQERIGNSGSDATLPLVGAYVGSCQLFGGLCRRQRAPSHASDDCKGYLMGPPLITNTSTQNRASRQVCVRSCVRSMKEKGNILPGIIQRKPRPSRAAST